VLIVLIFCLVAVSGLLSFEVVVWFVVLGMEEGWYFNLCVLGQKNDIQPSM
jgi:hypothetical protein